MSENIRLIKFELNNYRSCLKSSFDLPSSLMCLIGANGAGKTNLLSGLLLLKKIKGSTVFGAKPENENKGALTTVGCTLKYNEKTIKFKCDIRHETDDRNNEEVLNAQLKFDFSAITGIKKLVEIPAEMLAYVDQFKGNYWRHLFHKTTLTEREAELIVEVRNYLRRISYYSASQFSDPTKCPISFELEENRRFRSTRLNVAHEKFLNDLYLNYKNNNKLFQKFLSSVSQDGIGIVDNISFAEYDMPSSSYEVKSGGKIKKIERNRQLIIPYFTVDGIDLSPNQLSEGTFKTLALIFYIITDDNDLLLIEEPEVCVHHGLLNSIISLILSQSSKKQMVISTHSDFVLDQLQPDNLLIVTKQTKKGTTVKPLNKALTKNDFAALKEYLLNVGNLGEYWKEGGFDNV